MNEYKYIELLGKGSFGEVALHKSRKTGQSFAIKVLSHRNFENW